MKAQIISFHCTVRNKLGRLLSSTYNQEIITNLDSDEMQLPALAKGLKNLKKGQRRKISITAEEAYGFYHPELMMEIPRKTLPQGKALNVGDKIQIHSHQRNSRFYRVVQATISTLTLDANHPLAGQDLVFYIEATEVRDATPEEISSSCTTPGLNPRFH
jgi:FKBP-type peptidyl-prolyl cis-trans isomerase SlyD